LRDALALIHSEIASRPAIIDETIRLNFDHLSLSDRKIVTAVAARAEKNRKRIERNREIIRRLENSNDSQKNIAQYFGITKQVVSLIRRAARITRPHAPIPGRPPNRGSWLRGRFGGLLF